MTIKDVILNITDLLSHFDLAIYPETLRLSKFNDPKALPNATKFLMDLINFISNATSPESPKTETLDEMVEVAKLIGFPLWSSIETSSYACLKLFVWLIEKMKLIPLLEKKTISRMRNVLNCQSTYSKSPSSKFSVDTEYYERLLSNYYQKSKLQCLLREFCFNFAESNIEGADLSGLRLPGCTVTGSTALDIYAMNNEDISAELRELDNIINILNIITRFYSEYPIFEKWVNSVSYDLQKSQSPEYKLLDQIIELQAKIDLQLSRDSDNDDLFENLFVHCSSDSFVSLSNENMNFQLAEVNNKICKQKEMIQLLVKNLS